MSQVKNLQENLVYIERFKNDLNVIGTNLDRRYPEKPYDLACEEIFNKVRTRCSEEIEKLKAENTEIAQYVQNYSNEILKIISRVKEENYNNMNRKLYQTEILNEMILSANETKAKIESQLEECEKEEQKTFSSAVDLPDPHPILDNPPPVRTSPSGRKIRNVGDRPPVIKKRK